MVRHSQVNFTYRSKCSYFYYSFITAIVINIINIVILLLLLLLLKEAGNARQRERDRYPTKKGRIAQDIKYGLTYLVKSTRSWMLETFGDSVCSG